jgi:Na+/H+ antiporter NhaC
MWQVYFTLAAVLITAFALVFISYTSRKRGEADIKATIAEKAAQDADAVADIATNDKPSDVVQRLRDGKF